MHPRSPRLTDRLTGSTGGPKIFRIEFVPWGPSGRTASAREGKSNGYSSKMLKGQVSQTPRRMAQHHRLSKYRARIHQALNMREWLRFLMMAAVSFS